MPYDYDYIIIGSGAGGGTMAARLAPTGKKILVLERGEFLPQEEQNSEPAEVFGNSRYVSPDIWYDKDNQPFQPQVHYFVGGATKLYGAALIRLHPSDMRTWPVSYGTMLPYYKQAEQLYQVTSVPHEAFVRRFSEKLERAGYKPEPAPSGVQVSGPCTLCNRCDGFPCKVLGKSDADTICIRPTVRDYANVEVLTGCKVSRLEHDGERITSVHFSVTREMNYSYTAETFILAAGAVNSAAVWLRSKLPDPSDQAGRNYMRHNSKAVIAVTSEPNYTRFQKTLMINDFYDEFGSIQMLGRTTPEMWGHETLARMLTDRSKRHIQDHLVEFWLMTEDMPLPGNRVTVPGNNRIRLACEPDKTGTGKMHGLYHVLRKMLRKTGVATITVGKDMPIEAVAHQAGTLRMGDDPATSVVDRNCKAHQLANLYVTDSSVMPTVGAVNPALTVMANSLRVGDHLARQ